MIKPTDCAFPTGSIQNMNGDIQYGEGGLTKLEYFAGLAMQSSWIPISDCMEKNFEFSAKMAVTMAKALITELEKDQP